LALQPNGAFVIGVKLTEDHITCALTNLESDVIDRATISASHAIPEDTAQRVAEGIQVMLKSSGIPQKRLLGVGIGMAGIVDAERGVCRSSPILGWQDVPFAEMVERLTDFPVYLDNDVNTLTLVEMLYGEGVGFEHFLTITIGRGVGLGIVANGQLYRGMGGAGELGHTVVDPSGYTCDCGTCGCLETFVGDPWLLKHAQAHGFRVDTVEALAAAAEAGHPIAQKVLARAGETLGRAVATLVNVLNPQRIIFSGEGIRYGDQLLEPMRRALYPNVLPVLEEGLTVCVSPLGDDAWARGAASLVWRELFRSPQLASTHAP
jgi:predicted NBD/HSP70 family sugar kinase